MFRNWVLEIQREGFKVITTRYITNNFELGVQDMLWL